MARLGAAMERDRNGAAKAVQEIFGEAGKGNDTVRLTVEGGKALTTRFTMKAPVVTFLSKIGRYAQATFDQVGREVKPSKEVKKPQDDR